jgi:hypothetical protein
VELLSSYSTIKGLIPADRGFTPGTEIDFSVVSRSLPYLNNLSILQVYKALSPRVKPPRTEAGLIQRQEHVLFYKHRQEFASRFTLPVRRLTRFLMINTGKK